MGSNSGQKWGKSGVGLARRFLEKHVVRTRNFFSSYSSLFLKYMDTNVCPISSYSPSNDDVKLILKSRDLVELIVRTRNFLYMRNTIFRKFLGENDFSVNSFVMRSWDT